MYEVHSKSSLKNKNSDLKAETRRQSDTAVNLGIKSDTIPFLTSES